MPPYGIFSIADTPEELLSRGYGYGDNMIGNRLSNEERDMSLTKYDPAFERLNQTYGYFSAPYTGSIPFSNVGFLRGDKYQSFNDIAMDNPSFGGISGYRDTGGIMGIEPVKYSADFDTSYGVANEPDDTQSQEYIDQVKKSQSGGIGGLLKFLVGLAVPGAGLLMNLGQGGFNKLRGGFDKGLGALRNINQRIQNTDFGQSRTLQEYMMKRRERKQAERAQEAMPEVYRSAREQGFTNDRGGFSTNRADRAGTSVGSGQFSPSTSRGRSGY